jgi:hypothetical protein
MVVSVAPFHTGTDGQGESAALLGINTSRGEQRPR